MKNRYIKWHGAEKKVILKKFPKIVYFRKISKSKITEKFFKFVMKNGYNKWRGAKKRRKLCEKI